jgi:hypothetical protein
VIPFSLKIPVDSGVVLPNGGVFLGVEPVTDFELRGKVDDDQARDKDTGLRVWQVIVADLEQPDEQTRFRSTAEMKVRIFANERPTPPAPTMPGFPPVVAFTGLTLTPYVDSGRCGPANRNERCRGRLAYSLRATGMVAFRPATPPAADPAPGRKAA